MVKYNQTQRTSPAAGGLDTETREQLFLMYLCLYTYVVFFAELMDNIYF